MFCKLKFLIRMTLASAVFALLPALALGENATNETPLAQRVADAITDLTPLPFAPSVRTTGLVKTLGSGVGEALIAPLSEQEKSEYRGLKVAILAGPGAEASEVLFPRTYFAARGAEADVVGSTFRATLPQWPAHSK